MSVSIDLYHCEPHELQQHVSNPQISMENLEFYVKETLKLIEQQKIDDRESAQKERELTPSSPRSRGRPRRKQISDPLDNIDTISIASSTTSSRPTRRTRNRRQKNQDIESSSPRRTRKRSLRSNKMDEDTDNEDGDIFEDPSAITTKSNSVEYDWMEGVDINDDKTDSSSDDPLLTFNLKNIDQEGFEMLLSDNKTNEINKKSKKKKKKHKKDKSKKHKKHKKKKKKKRRNKNKNNESDDDYMITSDDEDFEEWDCKQYENKISLWSMSQLEKEVKSLERQIEEEKRKQNESSSSSSKSRKKSSITDSTDSDGIDAQMTLEEIEQKLRAKLNEGIDSNATYKEDPSKLYCICREPYDGTTQMICCDYCQEWYHLSCIGLSADKLSSVEKLKFKCPICNGADPTEITKHNYNATKYGASFDSPKSTPNPQHPPHPQQHHPLRSNTKRRFIADTESDTDNTMNIDKAKILLNNQRNEKYEKLIIELQNRLKTAKVEMRRKTKEMAERLSKAKHDIDEERKRRIAVEQHMEGAKHKSEVMVKELGDSFQQQKHELVNKLKKLEANKKKYKDSATENKKKIKELKEAHELRLQELENDVIPTLNDQLRDEKKKTVTLEQQINHIKQQQVTTQQQLQQQMNVAYNHSTKMQQQLSNKNAEAAKVQNLNSQLQHKMDVLHVTAQQNHQQWENITKGKEDKITNLEKQITALQQQNNALRSNQNMPQVVIPNNISCDNNNNNNNNNNNVSTPRPPAPITIPPTPGYLKFNDLEMEELKMCRELCQKLLDANLFQVEHMAARANLTKDLFISWVTGIGKIPTVINDLNQATMGSLPQLNPQQHLSMNCIRLLLIEIRKQLEQISNATDSHDADTINKVKALLMEFQTASKNYEQKMNEFKMITHNRLLAGCRAQGSMLEMFAVVGSNDNGEPKSEWVKVDVCNFDEQANRVLVRKQNDNSMQYAAIDSATLRLPESPEPTTNNNNNNNNNTTANNSNNNNNNNNKSPPTATTVANNSAMGMTTSMGAFNGGQMNFNGIPNIPPFHGAANVLPPFNDLQANNISNQHHISNTINTNNNISINGAAHDPIVIGDEEDNNNDNISRKSSSRKRKRDEISKSNKKKKGSKHHHSKHSKHGDIGNESSDSDESSSDNDDNDSDISSDSDTESESAESRKSKKKKKKKHHHHHHRKKSKKSKKDKKKSKKNKKKDKTKQEVPKKRKRGRPKKKDDDDDNRSVSISSTASTRKRRGTKRELPSSTMITRADIISNPNKKRKLNVLSTTTTTTTTGISVMNGGEYDVIDGGGESDKNDSVCRICKHPGDLVCCEGCPSAYHADCIRPRVKKEWLDAFEEWYCPSCAPRFSYIPLKYKKNDNKWPQNKEPLLKDLKQFLKKHQYLERDYEPQFHKSRKNKSKY